jgi:hypothetical protein
MLNGTEESMPRSHLIPSLPEALRTIDASVNNIPTAYSNAAGSRIRHGGGGSAEAFCMVNSSDSDLEISLDGVTSNFFLPAQTTVGPSVLWVEGTKLGTEMFLQAPAGAVITGKVRLAVW